ncbi:hemagglutinin repeat-containing protein, partial [Alteromonas ponticola]
MGSNEQQDKATTYTNSSLTAKHMNVVTSGDATISGGNLHGDDSLNMNIGGNLTLESVQNRYAGSSKGMGISAGMGFGNAGSENNTLDVNKAVAKAASNLGDTSAGAASVNGGLNASNSRYHNTETVLSSITGGNVNVDVNGNTAITGALIAAMDNNGNDNGALTLTTGTISYSDLNNRSYSSNQSASINANVGLTADAKHNESGTDTKLNSSNTAYQNNSSQSVSKTMATVGEGNVTVGGENAELAGLNRDAANTTNEIYDVDRQQGNIELTVDHRLLSEEGRALIKEDVKRTEILGESVADVLKASVSITGSGDGESSLREHIGNKQDYFTATKNFMQNEANAEHIATLGDA